MELIKFEEEDKEGRVLAAWVKRFRPLLLEIAKNPVMTAQLTGHMTSILLRKGGLEGLEETMPYILRITAAYNQFSRDQKVEGNWPWPEEDGGTKARSAEDEG